MVITEIIKCLHNLIIGFHIALLAFGVAGFWRGVLITYARYDMIPHPADGICICIERVGATALAIQSNGNIVTSDMTWLRVTYFLTATYLQGGAA